MTPDAILQAATSLALLLLSAGLLVTMIRIIRGPTLPDRIVGLDMLVAIAIGLIAAVAIRTGVDLYVDIAIALGLVGFLATVAFARFVMHRGMQAGEEGAPDEAPAGSRTRRSGGHARRLH